MDVCLGLDVGGTKVSAALVALDGKVHEQVVEQARTGEDWQGKALDVAVDAAQTLNARATASGIQVRALGAGFPEYVDPDGLLTSSEVIRWRQ